MFDADEPKTKKINEIELGCDLSTFSLSDIDERIELLNQEIARLKEEKSNKSNSIEAAQAFFKN